MVLLEVTGLLDLEPKRLVGGPFPRPFKSRMALHPVPDRRPVVVADGAIRGLELTRLDAYLATLARLKIVQLIVNLGESAVDVCESGGRDSSVKDDPGSPLRSCLKELDEVAVGVHLFNRFWGTDRLKQFGGFGRWID